MSDLKTELNANGTVTYWSVYDQVWEQDVQGVPDRELAAMGWVERRLVQEHLKGRDEEGHR